MITEETIRQFVARVSDQHYAMTGAVIAVSAAHATALGETCMQISLDNQVDTLDWRDVAARIQKMARLRADLLAWTDQDAQAITEHVAPREAGSQIGGQRLWFESAAEISRLSIDAAMLLQDFRPLVYKDVKDDLEITISLLTSIAYNALLLLDSNFNLWPETVLRAEYEELRAELQEMLQQLTPVDRLKPEH